MKLFGITIMRDDFEYALRYFEIHANQRMSTFNFFIILDALLVTALATSFDNDFSYPGVAYVISISIVAISFIFWKLDQRVRYLITHSEKALSKLEEINTSKNQDFPNLILEKNQQTLKLNKKARFCIIKAKMSYSQCFQAIYILFAIFGVGGLIVRLYLDLVP